MKEKSRENIEFAESLISQLEVEWAQVAGEIHRYPSPIPACDAQFNYLLEKRGKLAKELNLIREIRDGITAGLDKSGALKVFLEKSEFIAEK